tara:strand:+ start:3729 stop:4763 length:1035 start_codon:yes stop_codon:yes gene_type:complete
MGGYLSTPISIKKYIKIKPRKLISGFLHINVINHSDNDDASETGKFVDAYEYYRGQLAAGSLHANKHNADPWRAQAISNFADVSRSNKFLNFGDYDCLLFWVAGGMTLQEPLFTGSAKSTSFLSNGGYADTTSGKWYEGIDDYCQNFIKYDLISRINNGYGHAALNGDEDYNGTLAITKNEFRSDELGISGHDSTVTPPNYTATGGTNPNSHGGNFQKHIVSTGSYSNSGDGDINLSNGNANTFFPPVQSVEVYGTHRLNIVSQTGTTPSGSTELFSISTAGGYHHTDFWNLVIDIKMRGYDDTSPSSDPSQADKEWFKSRTNVFFQPFGETASFDVSDSEHTS